MQQRTAQGGDGIEGTERNKKNIIISWHEAREQEEEATKKERKRNTQEWINKKKEEIMKRFKKTKEHAKLGIGSKML